MMLDNSSYDKAKLVYKISRIIWFIEKHAIADAQNAGDKEFINLLSGLQKDLNKHLELLQKSACTVTQ